MKKTAACALALLVAALLLVPASTAAEEKKAAAPSAEDQAMMEAYMKAATPGPAHQEMAKMSGSWKMEVTSWMAPGAPPQTSPGTATFTMIMGGRYLQQTVKSEFGGMPFEGLGIEGYDNATGEHFGTWFDSMGTGVMVSRGKCEVGATTCTYTASMVDPVTKKKTEIREVMTMQGPDKFTFAMYGPDKGGKEYKMMEIVYTRT